MNPIGWAGIGLGALLLLLGCGSQSPVVGLFGALVLLLGVLAASGRRTPSRRDLEARFGPEVAAYIQARQLWQGALPEHVEAMFGRPLASEESVMHGRVRHTWKYDERRRGAYGRKVFFENGVVVGWEQK